jgi:hypothetical protein
MGARVWQDCPVVESADLKRLRRERLFILLVLWAVWIAYFAHYRWSSRFESVYPLVAPIAADGSEEEFRIKNVPGDTYQIFPAIEVTDEDRKFELHEQVQRAIDARPVAVRAVVTDDRGKELFRFDDDSASWVAGSMHTYLGAAGPQFIVLFGPDEIMSFEARSWSTYLLRISIKAEKSMLADQPLQIVIAGDRDDKVYPVKYILGLSASFLVLFVISLIFLTRRRVATET